MIPPMTDYTFQISQGGRSKPSITTDCPDDHAARREAGGMFADMARDVACDLESNPQWQIEVADEGGKPIFRIGILAESLK
jgi:uncharacterized protein DUF6894